MLAIALLVIPGAALNAQARDGPPPDLRRATAAHFEAYGLALSRGERDRIGTFYHLRGVFRILDGRPGEMSREAIAARYRDGWTPPAMFRWDGLEFRPLGPERVLVTGGFRWQSVGQADTSRYLYTAIVMVQDSGVGITFEQETRWPER